MWFSILGPVEVRVSGRQVPLPRAQRRAVLAFLLLHADCTVSADQLIEAIWGGAAPSTAKSQMHTAVSTIRTALRTASGQEPVTSGPAGYRVTAPADSVDLTVFRDLVRQAGSQAAEEAATTLRKALQLWRGRPLSGVSGAFVEPQRAQLDDLRLDVLEKLFHHELELGRHHEVAHELAELVAEHPMRQRLVGQLMLALHRCGRQAEALSTCRRARAHLAQELGTEPAAELEELHRQVLSNDPGLTAVPAAPQRRYLPRDLPDFTGRAAEMAELDQLSTGSARASGAIVITAIAGAGGVGKTALAVHWAHRVAARYPDGQFYVNLRGYDARRPMSTAEALGGLLRELDVADQRIPHRVEDAAALYRSTLSGQKVLILLDNARSAEQIRTLLPTGPGSLAVITSRDALAGLVARDGARRISLAPMPSADALERSTPGSTPPGWAWRWRSPRVTRPRRRRCC